MVVAMEDKLASFKAKYKRFLKDGSGDPLALKAEAEKLLTEIKARGNQNLARELEEILIDLTFTVEETRCHCHMTSRCRC
ncbi:MAG: hypothetical protein QXJ77_02495 [Candidatus Bathyarchaeia archaeon]